MKNRVCILFAFVFSCLFLYDVQAQENYEYLQSQSFGVGYFGDLYSHTGYLVFGEVALNKRENQLLAKVSFINYTYIGYTENYWLLPELVFRRNTNEPYYREFSIGAGVLHQAADSKMNDDNLEEFIENNSGYLLFAPSITARYGFNFDFKNGAALVPNIGIRVFYLHPFDDLWLLKSVVDLSLSYKLK